MKALLLFAALSWAACHPPGERHARGEANAHMHETPVEDLIKAFESPERDAYQQPDKVLAYIGPLDGRIVEDLGAGSGYFSVRLAKQGAHVIAADVDDRFLKYIRQRLPAEELDSTHVEVRKIPYDDCGLKTGEADVVLVVNTYHHLEERSQYFKRLKSGLSPDGVLIIIDFFKKDLPIGPPADHKIAEEQVSEELEEAGFTIAEVNTTLLPYQYIIKAR